MPSSKDRRRLEVPIHVYDSLQEIADTEDRTVASVAQELLYHGLQGYRSTWIPSKHLPRFTAQARTVLPLARAEAYRLNHHYIGTEHLLLGLLQEGEDTAAQVLNHLAIDLPKARAAVEDKIGRGEAPAPDEIDYVPRVRKVLGMAVAEAERLGHPTIGTSHLLLALEGDGQGVAAQVLDGFGALGPAREQALAQLRPPDASDATV